MPTNTFGPNDNYNSLNSHFLPALIKKTHQIKIQNKNELILWGNGLAKREVVYVDDIADACIYFMKKKIKENVVNIGHARRVSCGKQGFAKTIEKIPIGGINIQFVRLKAVALLCAIGPAF